MKERPILFSAPMVRAVLAGTKTQMRRPLKHEAPDEADGCFSVEIDGVDTFCWVSGEDQDIHPSAKQFPCPYGQPGDRLWVRESFAHGIHAMAASRAEDGPFVYAADGTTHGRLGDRWTPSIHMPRWASRITLENTGVRVERLQDISEADADAEGITGPLAAELRASGTNPVDGGPAGICAYARLWESINGTGSWNENPWVWVVEFKRMEGGAA